MSVPPLSPLVISHGTFTVFIAPGEVLTLASEEFLKTQPNHILYLCGNYPLILPNLHLFSDRFFIRRALTAFQILTILDESYQPLLIFEHDRSLFEDRADLLPIIGQRCREYASKNSRVILLASFPDMYIRALEPFSHRTIQVRTISYKEEIPQRKTSSKQQVLVV